METIDAIQERRSIKKFKPNEIPKEVISSILETSRWSPSWGNTQPWEICVITGKALEQFRDESVKMMKTMASSIPDVLMPDKWPDQMRKRYGKTGEIVLSALNIKRDDKESRLRQMEFMAALYGAPCLLVLCAAGDHSSIGYAMFDIGLITQTICLAAHDKGVGSCIMAMAVTHPEILRRIARIPDNVKIIIGIAMGYPESGFPLNSFERNRISLDEFVKWIE